MNFLLATIISLLGFATTPSISTTKTINTQESKIAWKGYKVLGSHEGTLNIKSGNLDFDGDQLTGGNFVIDMSSITVTDLEGEAAGKLVGHLSSPDFFGVKKYPTANFKITKVASRGTTGDYKITGDLTIKEVTKSISFKAKVDKASATGEVQIDRTHFNVKYGSGSFFDNLGDKTIYDEIDLVINLVL